MRDICQEHLDFGNDLLQRTERCIVDEICVSWRTLVMKFVWDGGDEAPLPGDILINFNTVFDVRIDGTDHRIDIDAIERGDSSSGSVLLLIKKRVKSGSLDCHRLQVLFENGWEIVVPMQKGDLEPVIIWDIREPVDWLVL